MWQKTNDCDVSEYRCISSATTTDSFDVSDGTFTISNNDDDDENDTMNQRDNGDDDDDCDDEDSDYYHSRSISQKNKFRWTMSFIFAALASLVIILTITSSRTAYLRTIAGNAAAATTTTATMTEVSATGAANKSNTTTSTAATIKVTDPVSVPQETEDKSASSPLDGTESKEQKDQLLPEQQEMDSAAEDGSNGEEIAAADEEQKKQQHQNKTSSDLVEYETVAGNATVDDPDAGADSHNEVSEGGGGEEEEEGEGLGDAEDGSNGEETAADEEQKQQQQNMTLSDLVEYETVAGNNTVDTDAGADSHNEVSEGGGDDEEEEEGEGLEVYGKDTSEDNPTGGTIDEGNDSDWVPSEKRRAPLDVSGYFSFSHIPKCAGASWINTFNGINLPGTFYPTKNAGIEIPVLAQKHIVIAKYPEVNRSIQNGNFYSLTSLKSPRHHLFAMFGECKYDIHWKWGTKSTRMQFPHSGVGEEGDAQDFDLWLSHFLTITNRTTNNNNTSVPSTHGSPDAINATGDNVVQVFVPAHSYDDYGCYHPTNFQTRYLTATYASSHHYGAHNPKPGNTEFPPEITNRLEPSPDYAIQTALKKELDWVAISDFFHESQCLLYYRFLLGVGNWTSPSRPRKPFHLESMRTYVNESCRCIDGDKPSSNKTKEVFLSHHKEGHRPTMTDLPKLTLDKIQALIRMDTIVYKYAITEFMKEIHWLESPSQLGRRVLCDTALHKNENELMYLDGMNVTELYYSFGKSRV